MEVGPPPFAGQPFPPAVPGPPPSRPGPWPVVAAVLVGCWAVAVTVPAELAGWLTDQVLLASGLDRAVWLWPVVAGVTVLLAGVPALLLTLLPRSGAVRATGRAWLAGLLAAGALILLRALPPVHHEAYLAALAVAAGLLAAVL
ncbi:peptidase S8, partial [Micromonospora sp. NPDC002296]